MDFSTMPTESTELLFLLIVNRSQTRLQINDRCD